MSYRGEMKSIGQISVGDYADKLAWKRSGFKDRKALEDAVRDLPLEKKVEMLTELNMSGSSPNGMATMLFKNKQEFLLSIGHKTWVDGDELYEYAKSVYTDKEWKIDRHDFHPICVFDGTHTNQMNTYVMDRMKEKRNNK